MTPTFIRLSEQAAIVTPTWVRLAELLAAVLFILALKGLSSPKTARRGNLLGAAGASIATAVVPPVCKARVATESPIFTIPLVVALIVEAINFP